jgi:uncharacterized Rmd1/YagE family protein
MLEREIESKVVRYCRKRNVLCYKFASPAHRGVPDRILVFPRGAVVFVELKQENGVLSALQKYEIDRLKNQGAEVYVFYSFERFRQWMDF